MLLCPMFSLLYPMNIHDHQFEIQVVCFLATWKGDNISNPYMWYNKRIMNAINTQPTQNTTDVWSDLGIIGPCAENESTELTEKQPQIDLMSTKKKQQY